MAPPTMAAAHFEIRVIESPPEFLTFQPILLLTVAIQVLGQNRKQFNTN
jgi:hypothetical protein